jgi:ribosomal protein L7/L12
MELVAASLVVVAVALMLGSVERKLGRIERRLRRMELRVDAVIESLGITAPTADADLQQVDLLLAQGKKVKAIKVYRDITGAGLAEAKEAVERRA